MTTSRAGIPEIRGSRSVDSATRARLVCRPEMQLLLACIWMEARTLDVFIGSHQQELDARRLLHLADFHGVTPILCRALDYAPHLVTKDVLASLRHVYRSTAQANLMKVRELLRVVKVLEEKTISVVPYKGPSLAAMIYDDISLREFSDLDFLVRPSDMVRAKEIVLGLGYIPEHPSRQLERKYLRSACEYNFKHKELGILLELHWQILPRQFSLQFDLERMWSRLESKVLGTSQVRCLNSEDMLIVLCAHAAKHLWVRLIWIADIARLILRSPELDWERICSHSAEIGAQRVLLVSVAVAGRIFALALPERIEQLLVRDSAAEKLEQVLVTRLLQGPKRISHLRHHLTLLRARENWEDKCRYACRTISAGVSTRLSSAVHRRPIS